MQIIVTRALQYRGTVYAAGAKIDADAHAAGELVASGRAMLANRADSDRVQAAVAEVRDRLLDGLHAAERQASADWVLRRRRA